MSCKINYLLISIAKEKGCRMWDMMYARPAPRVTGSY